MQYGMHGQQHSTLWRAQQVEPFLEWHIWPSVKSGRRSLEVCWVLCVRTLTHLIGFADKISSEGTTGRTLNVGANTLGGSSNLTVANCLSACQTAGYNLAGAEYSGE